MKTMAESGLEFEFEDSNCLDLEKCDTYVDIKSKSIKMCEFVFIKNGSIIFLEAKSSFSRPENAENFEKNISDIVSKMHNAVSLFSGISLKRPYSKPTTLPKNLILNGGESVYCILIVTGFEDEWLIPIQDALRIKLSALSKTFSIANVLAINEKTAISRGYAARLQTKAE